MNFKKIIYKDLNSKQKESYNCQKVSAILADYGFSTIKLDDDYQGADFLAVHINGKDILKIQLKGRLAFDKKYIDKSIFICFPYENNWYLFDHDFLLKVFLEKYKSTFAKSKSWIEKGGYSWNSVSKDMLFLLEKYKI